MRHFKEVFQRLESIRERQTESRRHKAIELLETVQDPYEQEIKVGPLVEARLAKYLT
jgi:hypothetical protein